MKKAMFGIPLIFLLALSSMNCSSPENTTTGDFSEYPVKIEKVDGIKTVMNPDYPRDGRIIYRISDDTTLGPETGPEETIVFTPRIIRVDALGNAYVLDAEDIRIKIYDVNGNWIRNVGRRGQGPGEYMNINDFDVTQDGDIFILDIPQRRITVFTSKGGFVSSCSIKGYGDTIRVDEIGLIYFQQNISYRPVGNSGSKVMEMILSRTDSKGGNYIEYGKYPYLLNVWRPVKSAGGTRVQNHFSLEAHTTVWIPNGIGRLYLGYSRDYLISVLDKKGNPIFKFGREFKPIKHPEFSRDLAHPRYYPAFNSRFLFFDDESNLWLKQYMKSGEPEHVYDVFSPDGVYIQQAVVPARLYKLHNGIAYTIIRYERGVYEAKRFKLSANGS